MEPISDEGLYELQLAAKGCLEARENLREYERLLVKHYPALRERLRQAEANCAFHLATVRNLQDGYRQAEARAEELSEIIAQSLPFLRLCLSRSAWPLEHEKAFDMVARAEAAITTEERNP